MKINPVLFAGPMLVAVLCVFCGTDGDTIANGNGDDSTQVDTTDTAATDTTDTGTVVDTVDTITAVSDSDAVHYIVGLWQLRIRPIPGVTTDTLQIDFDIDADSTYFLTIIDVPSKTLFSHEGAWAVNDTDIILTGTECAALDTSADTLAPLPDSVCSMPMAVPMLLDTTDTPWEWIIQASTLGPALDAFPVPEYAKPMLRNVKLQLQKQE
ncbi:MAG: hypothetical protein GF418_07350 [Chitinivibrionales bacterium]|nr:hypothetical protein [Chitinivibrionales bacterium]